MSDEKLSSSKKLLAITVGSLVYAALNIAFNPFRISETQLIALRPSVAIPMFLGYIFGPLVGFATGFLGNVIGDAVSWGGFWWNWDVGNGLLGLVPGLALYLLPEEERYSRKGLLAASLLAAAGSILGVGFASYIDYALGYGVSTPLEAFNELFLPAAVSDAINGALLTPLLVAAYAALRGGRERRKEGVVWW